MARKTQTKTKFVPAPRPEPVVDTDLSPSPYFDETPAPLPETNYTDAAPVEPEPPAKGAKAKWVTFSVTVPESLATAVAQAVARIVPDSVRDAVPEQQSVPPSPVTKLSTSVVTADGPAEASDPDEAVPESVRAALTPSSPTFVPEPVTPAESDEERADREERVRREAREEAEREEAERKEREG